MTFKSQLTADASSVFMNSSEFAEIVDYEMDGALVPSISGVFEIRDGDSQLLGGGRAAFAEFLVEKANVPTPKAHDKVFRYPGTSSMETWYVNQVVSGDDQMWTLGIIKGMRPTS